MAFEAFLTEGKKRPKLRRRVITTLSLVAHGGLAMAAVVYSFWHVDELSPPTVTVTFLTAAPPPPPPPPAAKKTAKVKPVTPKEIVQPKANEIVQPKKKEEPEEEDDGVVGGVAGGVAGGVSTLHAAQAPQAVVEAPPRFVPPNIAGQQLLTNPMNDKQYAVAMPGALANSTMRLWAMVKVCVSKQGTVSSATLVKSMDPSVDPLLIKKILTYRYKPMTVDGNPITFCYNLRYEHATR